MLEQNFQIHGEIAYSSVSGTTKTGPVGNNGTKMGSYSAKQAYEAGFTDFWTISVWTANALVVSHTKLREVNSTRWDDWRRMVDAGGYS